MAGTLAKKTEALAAVAGALALALSFGLNYGVSNQNTYLLGALRLVHPDLLRHDWLATETTDYHGHFAYLGAALLRLSEGGWPFVVANLVLVAAGGLIVFLLIRADDTTPLPALAYLLVMAFAIVTGTYSVGQSYWFSGILQPSSLAALGLLLSTCLFVRGRFLASGVALGVAGFFHTNFLVLGLLVFFLAHLLLGERRLVERVLRQMVPAIVLALPSLPLLLGAASAAGDAGGLQILFKTRAPHHYDPASFKTEFLALAGWLALLALTVPKSAFSHDSWLVEARRGRLVLALLVILGTLGFLSALDLRQATQLYPWRLAPVVVLFTQIYVARSWLRLLTGRPYDGLLRPPLVRFLVLLFGAGLLMLYFWRYSRSDYFLWVALLLLLATLGSAVGRAPRQWPRGRFEVAIGLLVVVAFGLATIPLLTDVRKRSSMLTSRPASEESLYAWARTVPLDAVFLIPPEMDDFRLQSRRAVVVDWKSTPLLPAELSEWYWRVSEVAGGIQPRSEEQAAAGYSALTAGQFRRLADQFAPSFVVAARGENANLPAAWPVAFENERFEVRMSR